jgi:hypothetical protein
VRVLRRDLLAVAILTMLQTTCASAPGSPEGLHQSWIDRVRTLVGRSRSEVLAELGEPTSKTYREGLEAWGYLGTYGASRFKRNRVVYLIFSGDRLVEWEEAREELLRCAISTARSPAIGSAKQRPLLDGDSITRNDGFRIPVPGRPTLWRERNQVTAEHRRLRAVRIAR